MGPSKLPIKTLSKRWLWSRRIGKKIFHLPCTHTRLQSEHQQVQPRILSYGNGSSIVSWIRNAIFASPDGSWDRKPMGPSKIQPAKDNDAILTPWSLFAIWCKDLGLSIDSLFSIQQRKVKERDLGVWWKPKESLQVKGQNHGKIWKHRLNENLKKHWSAKVVRFGPS